MASMFDFFTNRAAAPQPVDEEERRRQQLLAITRSAGVPTPLTTSAAPATEIQRPRLTPLPTVGAQPIPETTMAPTYSTTPRPRLGMPETPMPFQLVPGTYEPTVERRLQLARERTDHLRDTQNNPVVNNDRGAWGRIGDVLRQAVISAAEGYSNTPGDAEQKLMGAIGGGIAGGFGGGFRPTLDEERQRLYDINRSQENEQRLLGQLQQDNQLRLQSAQAYGAEMAPGLKAREIAAEENQTLGQNTRAQQETIFKAWQEAKDFKMSDPKYSNLVLQAQQFGVPIFDKEPEGNYYATWSPDGTLAIVNTKTGQERKGFGGEKHNRPTSITQSDLADEMFPSMMSDQEIDLRATEAVAPEMDSVEVDQNTVNDMIGFQNSAGEFPYRVVNPDGSFGFNKNKFLQDAAFELAPANYNNLYKSKTRSIANKIAAKKRELLEAQKPLRAQVATLKTRLKGRDPEYATFAVDTFNSIMLNKKGKEREAALKEFFSSLN